MGYHLMKKRKIAGARFKLNTILKQKWTLPTNERPRILKV